MGLHEGQEGITTLHYSGNMHTQALGPREGQVLLDKKKCCHNSTGNFN